MKREAMFCLGVFLAGELEKCRRRDQATIALVEAASFRLEIEHGSTATGRRKTEIHLHQFNDIAGGSHRRRVAALPSRWFP